MCQDFTPLIFTQLGISAGGPQSLKDNTPVLGGQPFCTSIRAHINKPDNQLH